MDAQFLLPFQGNFSSSKGCQANGDVFFPYRKQENEIINAYYPRKWYFCVWECEAVQDECHTGLLNWPCNTYTLVSLDMFVIFWSKKYLKIMGI